MIQKNHPETAETFERPRAGVESTLYPPHYFSQERVYSFGSALSRIGFDVEDITTIEK